MKPFVLLNSAMTVDGKIATEDSQLKISGKKDIVRVHQLRKEFDGIMVGINTVIIDNPKLTISKIKADKEDNPARIIVDSSARIPLESKVLNDAAKTILLVSKKAEQSKINKLKDKCEIIIVGEEQVNLKEALEKVYEQGIHSILLEGGSTLNFSMFQNKLIDKVSICIGSKILGGKKSKTFVDGDGFNKDNCVNLKLEKYYTIDEDIVLEYDVSYD